MVHYGSAELVEELNVEVGVHFKAQNDWRDVWRPSSCNALHIPPSLVVVSCCRNCLCLSIVVVVGLSSIE